MPFRQLTTYSQIIISKMKRKILIYTLLIFTINLFSQDLLFENDITLKSGFTDKRESFPIVNDNKNEIVLFLLDNQEINCLLFNKKYELLENYVTNRPESNFTTLLGYSADSLFYHIFFTNKKKNIFYTKSVNIADKKAEEKQLSIKLKNEKFLETISYKDKFYLITIKKYSSVMKIYEFSGNSISNNKEFDFTAVRFSNPGNLTLFDILKQGNSNLEITKIDNTNPNSLDLTTKKKKLYYYDNKIYLTFDNNLENTKIITIDLATYKSSFKYYSPVIVDCDNRINVTSNSYLFKDKLFQIKGCKEELGFQVKNVSNDSVLKDYRVKDDEEITYKNTPLMQEGGTTIFTQGLEREIGKTKQILRKISASDIGISVYPSQDEIELTIGGILETNNSGVPVMPMAMPGTTISTPHGTITTPTRYYYNGHIYHYNPVMYSYNKYTHTRTVYFKTLMDNKNFNHLEGNIMDNPFDKIKDFEDAIDDQIKSATIFKVDNYYVFGYYDSTKEKYCLRKFSN